MNNAENTNPHEDTWKVLVLFIREIAEDKGITHEIIAQRTGLIRSNVSRMFQLKYIPTLQMFLKLLNAVGVNMFFEDRESKSELNQLFEKAMEELGRRVEKLPKN